MTFNEADAMGKLIFFVDDDKMILNLLEYTFKNRDDYEVKTFRSGEDCINALQEKPDLIVLDHFFDMPGAGTGLETLQKIRENGNEVPVIMLSSQPDENLIPEFIKSGALKYIPKDSYFIDSLIESIEEVV